MQENTDQNNSESEHFLRSDEIWLWDYEIMRFDIIFIIRYIFTTIAIIQKQPFSNSSSKLVLFETWQISQENTCVGIFF